MHEALELRRQRHVNDDAGQPEDEEDLLADVLVFLGLAGPAEPEARGEIAREHLFDLIDGRAQRDPDERGRDGGAAKADVVFDGVGRSPFAEYYNAAELNEAPVAVAHVKAVEVLRRKAVGARQLGDDIVFLSFEFDMAEVQAAEEDLQGAREVFNAHAERGGAVAVDSEAQFGLGDLETGAGVDNVGAGTELVDDSL